MEFWMFVFKAYLWIMGGVLVFLMARDILLRRRERQEINKISDRWWT